MHLVFFTLHESQARVIFCRPAPFLFDSDPEAFLLRPGVCASAVSTTLSSIPGPEPCCVGIRATMLPAAMSGSTLGKICQAKHGAFAFGPEFRGERERRRRIRGRWEKARVERLGCSPRVARRGALHPRIYITLELEQEQPLLANIAREMDRGHRRAVSVSRLWLRLGIYHCTLQGCVSRTGHSRDQHCRSEVGWRPVAEPRCHCI